MMDDVLVFGQTQQEHDLRLEAVLKKNGVTLNLEKCQFSTDAVKFLGHVRSSKNPPRSMRSNKCRPQRTLPSYVNLLLICRMKDMERQPTEFFFTS